MNVMASLRLYAIGHTGQPGTMWEDVNTRGQGPWGAILEAG